MSIILTSPWWFIPLCLLVAAIPAVLLYRNSFFYKENKRLAFLLGAMRFIAFFFLAFLLLEPLIKTTETRVEKPIVLVLADNSLSVVSLKDSTALKQKIIKEIGDLSEKLSTDFETASFSFGEKVVNGTDSLNFKGKLTDISAAIDEIYSRFYNRNLGAVVLLTDGIYNKGLNPLTTIKKFKNVPFYTIGLGDTTITRDLILSDILYNKTAYLGNDYPIELVLQAKKMQGVKCQLIVKENNVEVHRREILIQSNNQTIRTTFLLSARKEGQQKITAEIMPVQGEFSIKNNTLTTYVNVIKNKQRVLILAAAPHPDVAAIKYALEASQNYQVVSQLHQLGATYNFKENNLIVLHGLPAVQADEDLIKKIKAVEVPILFVVSSSTALAYLNKAVGILNISSGSRTSNNTQAILNQNFTSFTLTDNVRKNVSKFPPLACPFGDYKTAPAANVLFWQKVGSVATANPLVLFNKENSNKLGVICGEGVWQWKMHDFELNQNNEVFNEIVQKTVQYLSVVENKTNFKVSHKNQFSENEPVMFDAELLNESYEPVNDPDVQMEITNQDKKVFKFVFSRSGKMYYLNAGMLPPGEYAYTASTSYGKKSFSKSGRFIITAVNTELLRTEADHRLLYQMAANTGGKFYNFKNFAGVLEDIKKNENVASVSYEEKTMDDLINKKWLIIIPIVLLALEWFLRKRAGAY